MSFALNIFCFAVPLTIMFAAALSVAIGVGGCGWAVYDRAVLIDIAFWKFSNNPPNYDSMYNAMAFLIMLHSTCTGPFSGCITCIGVLYFGPRKKYSPALLHVSRSDMQDASKYMWRIILLLLYYVTASRCAVL